MKKQQWKSVFSCLLSAVMLLTMLPITASAAPADYVWVGDIALHENEYLAAGADAVVTEKPADNYAHLANGVLTLHNFSLEDLYGLDLEGDLTLVLEGKNSIVVVPDGDYMGEGIYAESGDLTIQGSGSLSIDAYDAICLYDGDLTVNNTTLNITAEDDGIYVLYGTLTINNSTLNIESFDDEGLDVGAGKLIINGGKITINAGDHGIEVDPVYSEDPNEYELGQKDLARISGAVLDITAYDEGIDVEGDLEINGSTITIHDADIGLDGGGDITVSESTLNITCRDNALESSANLTITDSSITVDSTNIGLYGDDSVTVDSKTLVSIEADEAVVCTYGSLDIPAAWGQIGSFAGEEDTERLFLVDADGNPLTTLTNYFAPSAAPAGNYWLAVLLHKYNTTCPITVLTTDGGSVEGDRTVKYGRSATFTITPDEGFIIADVLVNGKSVGAVESYTFKKVRRAQQIEVIFAPDPAAVTETPAEDIVDPMYSGENAA